MPQEWFFQLQVAACVVYLSVFQFLIHAIPPFVYYFQFIMYQFEWLRWHFSTNKVLNLKKVLAAQGFSGAFLYKYVRRCVLLSFGQSLACLDKLGGWRIFTDWRVSVCLCNIICIYTRLSTYLYIAG